MTEPHYLDARDIAALAPRRLGRIEALREARQSLEEIGQWTSNQQMGRRWAVACVALEITQRCNLDCSLCYLSEHSEAVADLPLAELLRRIDMIREQYGERTDVQITGGEPTLRDHDELLQIVGQVRRRGMRPTLMTNGIRARRPLLEALQRAGLVDVAFHVDTTQGRRGYATERDLNRLRDAYLERARGLSLSVMFNTTVHAGNVHEVADLAGYFARRSDRVRTASFQLQADTGRGVQRGRPGDITRDNVAALIQEGAGTAINFEAIRPGHRNCNRYGLCLAVNGRVTNLFDDTELAGRLQVATECLALDRARPKRAALALAVALAQRPRLLMNTLAWALPKVWRLRNDLLAARGRVHTLSYLVHNFMHEHALEAERVAACAFSVMTADGPLSMCLHNAKRDEYILKPLLVPGRESPWRPMGGAVAADVRTLSRRGGRPMRHDLSGDSVSAPAGKREPTA